MNHMLLVIKQNWVILTLLTFIAISVLSLLPQDHLPSVPGTDKSHHVIAYVVLMFPVALRKARYWQLIGIFFVVYSGGIELVQPYVNRYGEWLDLAANSAGVLLGVLVAELINRRYLFPSSSRLDSL